MFHAMLAALLLLAFAGPIGCQSSPSTAQTESGAPVKVIAASAWKAVTPSGVTIELWGAGEGTTKTTITEGPVRQTSVVFPGHRLKDIRSVALQARPFEWIVFTDIALQPH